MQADLARPGINTSNPCAQQTSTFKNGSEAHRAQQERVEEGLPRTMDRPPERVKSRRSHTSIKVVMNDLTTYLDIIILGAPQRTKRHW